MKRMKFLFVGLIVILMSFGCGKNDSNLKVEDIDSAEMSENLTEDLEEESQEESKNEVKTYETLAELRNAISSFVDNTYTDGSVECFSDEYNDTTYVMLEGERAYTSITKIEGGYGLIFHPYMVALKWDDGTFQMPFTISIQYASNSFLDYLFSADCIFLAGDGTKFSCPINPTNQYEEDSLFYTDMLIYFTDSQKDEIDLLYEIIQKDNLSMRIDQMNNNDEYVTIDLDATTQQSIKDTIEVYYELYDGIYK